jgi:hypothetical protein
LEVLFNYSPLDKIELANNKFHIVFPKINALAIGADYAKIISSDGILFKKPDFCAFLNANSTNKFVIGLPSKSLKFNYNPGTKDSKSNWNTDMTVKMHNLSYSNFSVSAYDEKIWDFAILVYGKYAMDPITKNATETPFEIVKKYTGNFDSTKKFLSECCKNYALTKFAPGTCKIMAFAIRHEYLTEKLEEIYDPNLASDYRSPLSGCGQIFSKEEVNERTIYHLDEKAMQDCIQQLSPEVNKGKVVDSSTKENQVVIEQQKAPEDTRSDEKESSDNNDDKNVEEETPKVEDNSKKRQLTTKTENVSKKKKKEEE